MSTLQTNFSFYNMIWAVPFCPYISAEELNCKEETGFALFRIIITPRVVIWGRPGGSFGDNVSHSLQASHITGRVEHKWNDSWSRNAVASIFIGIG